MVRVGVAAASGVSARRVVPLLPLLFLTVGCLPAAEKGQSGKQVVIWDGVYYRWECSGTGGQRIDLPMFMAYQGVAGRESLLDLDSLIDNRYIMLPNISLKIRPHFATGTRFFEKNGRYMTSHFVAGDSVSFRYKLGADEWLRETFFLVNLTGMEGTPEDAPSDSVSFVMSRILDHFVSIAARPPQGFISFSDTTTMANETVSYMNFLGAGDLQPVPLFQSEWPSYVVVAYTLADSSEKSEGVVICREGFAGLQLGKSLLFAKIEKRHDPRKAATYPRNPEELGILFADFVSQILSLNLPVQE